MNTYATPSETMPRSSSNSFTATTTNNAEMRARPRRIADLLIVRGGSSAADGVMNARGAHSSAHWVAVMRDPHAGKQAPAHVKALARELGVDTSLAWDALDDMYG
jgi:hypothetical protein